MLSPFLKGLCCEILDDGHFMNHSEEPNCVTRSDLSAYALRDIEAGEQLFEDYSTYEYPDVYYELCETYKLVEDYFEHPPREESSESSTPDRISENH